MSSVAVIRGDTFNSSTVSWVWKDENGAAIDISGYTAKLYVATTSGNVVLEATTSGSAGSRLLISTGTDGKIEPDVSATNMAVLGVGTHEYDLELTSSSGVVTTIVNKGPFVVQQDIQP